MSGNVSFDKANSYNSLHGAANNGLNGLGIGNLTLHDTRSSLTAFMI